MDQSRGHEGVWIETGEAPSAGRSRGVFLRTYGSSLWRLFFIQSSRNERTMDGLGFYSILAPLIRRWARTDRDAVETARRHLGYFNANPYIAAVVAGAVANLEERRARGGAVSPDEIDRVKSALSSALSARGNYFFETVLMPLGLTIAAIFAIYSSFVGCVIFLALYNSYHFQCRIGGFCTGVGRGEGVGGAFVTGMFWGERVLGNCAAFASGMFAALLFSRARAAGGASFLAWGAVVIAAASLLTRRLSFLRSAAALFAATVLYLVARSYVLAKLR